MLKSPIVRANGRVPVPWVTLAPSNAHGSVLQTLREDQDQVSSFPLHFKASCINTEFSVSSFRLCNESGLHSEVPQVPTSSKGPEIPQSLLLPLPSDEFTIETAFHEWRGATFAVLNHFANNMSSTDASYVRQLIVSQNLLLDQEMKHHDRKRSFLRLMGQELDRIILRNADAVDKS